MKNPTRHAYPWWPRTDCFYFRRFVFLSPSFKARDPDDDWFKKYVHDALLMISRLQAISRKTALIKSLLFLCRLVDKDKSYWR